MVSQTDRTSILLRDTESVAYAAERLKDSLGAGAAKEQYAVDGLERAGTSQEEGAARFRGFMFEELGAATTTQEHETAADDVIALAVADLQVAGVFMAAGQAVGEDGGSRDPSLLDAALRDLRATTRELERAASATQGHHFAFEEDVGVTPRSGDLASAVEAFRLRADGVLETLVNDVQGTAGKVIDKLPWARAAQALSSLGQSAPKLPRVGRLIQLGMRKVEAALDALSRLVGPDALSSIRDRIEQLLNTARQGIARESVERLIDADGARAHVAHALQPDSLQAPTVDDGTAALAGLEAQFKAKMRYLDFAVGAAGFVGLIGTASGRPELSAVSAAALVLALAVAVLFARDNAASGRTLRLGSGIRGIADGIGHAD